MYFLLPRSTNFTKPAIIPIPNAKWMVAKAIGNSGKILAFLLFTASIAAPKIIVITYSPNMHKNTESQNLLTNANSAERTSTTTKAGGTKWRNLIARRKFGPLYLESIWIACGSIST